MSTLTTRLLVVGTALGLLAISIGLMVTGAIGSEFLPHLDEGAIWARGTLSPSTGPEEGVSVMNQARLIFASFPEVTTVVSQVGRPDDGTDSSLFSNTEYFVDLKPKEQWRSVFQRNKEELIRAMDREVTKMPGVIWNYSQPIADNMEEAVSGVKGELAIKIFGTDLDSWRSKGDEIIRVMGTIKGRTRSGFVSRRRTAESERTVDRAKASRFGLNVSDVQDAVQTAVGGNAVSQVLQGEQRYDLVVRYLPEYAATMRSYWQHTAVWRPPASGFPSAGDDIQMRDGASQIYRENNSRYVAIKYSVRGRDLGSTVEEAITASIIK